MTETFISLAGSILMICLILFLAWWCSRMLGRGYIKAASGQNITVLEQIRIGSEQRLLLVRLKGKIFLLGVSQAGIQMLAELKEDSAEEFSALIKTNGGKGDE